MSEARNAVASATGPLFDMGVRAERERIIAVLKSVDDELGIFGVGWTMQEIAELIKGENE